MAETAPQEYGVKTNEEQLLDPQIKDAVAARRTEIQNEIAQLEDEMATTEKGPGVTATANEKISHDKRGSRIREENQARINELREQWAAIGGEEVDEAQDEVDKLDFRSPDRQSPKRHLREAQREAYEKMEQADRDKLFELTEAMKEAKADGDEDSYSELLEQREDALNEYVELYKPSSETVATIESDLDRLENRPTTSEAAFDDLTPSPTPSTPSPAALAPQSAGAPQSPEASSPDDAPQPASPEQPEKSEAEKAMEERIAELERRLAERDERLEERLAERDAKIDELITQNGQLIEQMNTMMNTMQQQTQQMLEAMQSGGIAAAETDDNGLVGGMFSPEDASSGGQVSTPAKSSRKARREERSEREKGPVANWFSKFGGLFIGRGEWAKRIGSRWNKLTRKEKQQTKLGGVSAAASQMPAPNPNKSSAMEASEEQVRAAQARTQESINRWHANAGKRGDFE